MFHICDVNLHALGIFIHCCLLLEAVVNNVGGSGRWFTGLHFFMDHEPHHRLEEEVDLNHLKYNLTLVDLDTIASSLFRFRYP
jgi:hypothetical protein